jgi:hypothetical protein
MDLTTTLIGLGSFGTLLAVGLVLDRRPYAPGRMSWIPAMMIGLIGVLVFAAHLATLLRR